MLTRNIATAAACIIRLHGIAAMLRRRADDVGVGDADDASLNSYTEADMTSHVTMCSSLIAALGSRLRA